MYLAGFSINNLSLMALIVAAGFVVDDAIVVLENTARHVEEGMPAPAAALLGAREVGSTVVSMSLSLVAVFIPILLMGDLVGRLFREFALTLSVAVLISMVVSLTLTPMMCARLLGPRTGGCAERPPAPRRNWLDVAGRRRAARLLAQPHLGVAPFAADAARAGRRRSASTSICSASSPRASCPSRTPAS